MLGRPQHELSEQCESSTHPRTGSTSPKRTHAFLKSLREDSNELFNTEALLLFQGVGVYGWLVVGEGLPTVRVLPIQQCQKHCSSFNLWLNSGDMGNFHEPDQVTQSCSITVFPVSIAPLRTKEIIRAINLACVTICPGSRVHGASADAHAMLVLCPPQSMLTLGTGRWSCTRAEAKILFATALLPCVWKIKDAAQDCGATCVSNVNVLLLSVLFVGGFFWSFEPCVASPTDALKPPGLSFLTPVPSELDPCTLELKWIKGGRFRREFLSLFSHLTAEHQWTSGHRLVLVIKPAHAASANQSTFCASFHSSWRDGTFR